MNPNDDNRQEDRLAELLSLAAGAGMPPPDEAFLDRLRRQSAAVFAAESAAAPAAEPPAAAEPPQGPSERLPSPAIPRKRRHRMSVLALRTLAASLAATVLAVVTLWNAPPGDDSALAFGRVLEKTAAAKSLHLKIVREGKTSEVFARPQQLRWNEPDGTYRIARGSELWRVDEKANRAARETAALWAGQPPRLDLLGLLGLPGQLGERLAGVRPAEQIQRDGRPCLLYRIDVPWRDAKLKVEALVDAGTQFLHSLEAKTERDGRVEPLARIEVVSLGQPLAEELFVVGDTLTEDGRIGKLSDLQGLVAVRPAAAERWTPLDGPILLRSGDWLRTDLRGANAAALRLVKDTAVALGPGSLAELAAPNRMRLAEGEIKIAAAPKAPVELLGPGGEKVSVEGTQLYRVQNGKLVRLEKEPLWLRAFEGRTTADPIGSLVAKVEGRNVPLTVGFHKVTVDVRDQIARTVIEESFVNHTAGQLEGVFYFPLPADASISGFGMWIGDKLVQADVVEKQRAREIYETILRERRDPGLLEWTGGNIFKARVFPIFAHSEKRITITYTQVLPLKGNRCRYQYALQSEMLKQHPLRELSIDVNVSSVLPLAGVTCPTHPARINRTTHAARVEFTAQEYTPTRDFEVVVEVDGRQSEVVLIPHRRGEDGYFMVQLTPPGPGGAWQRDLLPDGEPMELLILADTSASIDSTSRSRQAQLIAALLASLTPKDTFNLAACDVDADWAFEKSRPADAGSIAAAREMLAERVSLGWTDLDKAFASLLARCGPKTRVVYAGDGIVNTGDGDPVAFAKRLRRMYEAKFAAPPSGTAGSPEAIRESSRTGVSPVRGDSQPAVRPGEMPVPFYAVALGSSYEQLVLKTIASLGGGSIRQITGDRPPQTIARELLEEMVQPAIRDVKVEFRGLRTAQLYPEELPNLPPGSQQIILGRYLPEGRDQSGEVIVTGTLGGKPVRFASPVSLKDAEQGNSFIPRLWARMHLDALLQQGASQAIQDEIIALSEEYNIITPYTSLLVLESDADRERFKVKTRFRMRDAEKMFAEGREDVRYELTQQQMKRAGTWRLGLRRAVLQQLQTLGRNAGMLQPERYAPGYGDFRFRGAGMGGMGGFGPAGGASGAWYREAGGRLGEMADFDSRIDLIRDTSAPEGWRDGGGEGTIADFKANLSLEVSQSQQFYEDYESPDYQPRHSAERELAEGRPFEEPPDASQEPMDAEELNGDKIAAATFGGDIYAGARPSSRFAGGLERFEPMVPLAPETPVFFDRSFGASVADEISVLAGPAAPRASATAAGNRPMSAKYFFGLGELRRGDRAGGWLDSVFPYLPPPPPAKEKEPKKRWPAEARRSAESLLRTETLARLSGGLRIERRGEQFDPRWGELTSRSESLALVSPAAWLVRSGGDRGQTALAWCDARERGAWSKAFQLGRLRAATPADLRKPPLDLSGYVLQSIERTYSSYRVELKPQGDDRVLLVLSHPSNRGYELQVLVDTARKVILWMENRQDGKLTSATRFGDFVEVAGAWFAGRIETFDAENRRTSSVTQKFEPLAAGQFESLWKEQLAGRDQVLFLRVPLPKLADAKQAISAGKATFEDHLVLMLHFERSQQWPLEWEHFEKAAKLAAGKPGLLWAGKPGLPWVRAMLLNLTRRREEFKQWAAREAEGMARPRIGGPYPPDELFLAEFLLGQASGALEANEMLGLLDTLRPIFARQVAYLKALRNWSERRAGYLEQTGQWEQALTLRKQLAEQYPRDCEPQRQYARALTSAGELEAAYAWIERVLKAEMRWSPNEEESLREMVTELLRSQGRYPELVDYLAAWIKRNPPGGSPYQQYLSALVWADRMDEANAVLARWLNEAQTVEKYPVRLSEAELSRLRAAVSQALGRGYNLQTQRIDPRWPDPLADLVLFCARHDVRLDIAQEIMGDWRFMQTDSCRRARKELAKMLRQGAEKLSPEQIERFVGWIMPNDPAVEPEVWQKIIAVLRQRWSAETRPELRHRLGSTLVQVLSSRAKPEELLEFLRLQLRSADEEYRTAYARQLFDTLLGQPWSAEHENEAFTLLGRLSEAEEPAERLAAAVAALYRLTDRMVQARFDARMKAIEHQEKLTRTELAAKRAENHRLAREGFADRLREETRKAPAELGRWLTCERLYLDVLAGRNLDKVADECWELLGPEPQKPAAAEDAAQALDAILRNRCLVTLANLAARKTATPAAVDRVLKYLDRAIAQQPDQIGWKLFKVQLLVALDRPKDLEQALRTWIASGDADNRWRQALAYLAAEQGRLDEAIKLFEAIRAAHGLGPTDYRALANWYMATNRREDHDRAVIDAYKTVEDWRLSNWLYQRLNPWRQTNRPLPSELDKEVLLVFAALFDKSSQPQQYLGQLREFYQATRDFRLLAGLADAVLGQTTGKVYPFLEGMGPVFSEVQDEATVDSIVQRIAEVRKRAKTPIDQRALDLLEVLAERRAAELKNQPGPHADRALAALRRAFKRAWSPGEPRLVADFLAALGNIAHRGLAEEQVRQLESLYRDASPGTIDRLHVARALAIGYWHYSLRPRAIDLLQDALDEYQQAMRGVLPQAANDALDTLIDYLQQERHYARGETVLQEQLKHPANRQQVYWLVQRLYRLYEDAIRNGGDVSLGSGQALYEAVHRKLQAELDTPDDNHRFQLLTRLLGIYRTAHERKPAGVAPFSGVEGDLRQFAFQRLPQVLKRQTNHYQDMVGNTAQTLHDLISAREGLAFLVERIESEPRWFRLNNQDGWSRHGYQLAQWRTEAGSLGPLEDRLLRIVLAELREDLASGQSRNRQMYDRQHDSRLFWAAKADAFAQAAEEVLAAHRQSGATLSYIAEYLYHGLDRHARAIEILLDAHRREILDESGQSRLVQFLHWQNRYGESIPILEPLVQRRPDNVQYRTWLLHAYFRTKQPAKLLALLRQTDEYFHKDNRWQEHVIAALAYSCLENELYEQSVAYYKEVIPLHQRTSPRRGTGDGVLSSYYGHFARAYAGLGKTAEAVDAACGAIVSWGPQQSQRAQALESLKQVLRQAGDLDAYVRQLDKKTEETGLDNPIVRKAIGQVYLDKQQYAKAIPELALACELQPNDPQTHQALVTCYDRQNDRPGAIRQVLRQVRLTPREAKLYEDLARRYQAMGQEEQAERAYTSIVEMLPSESESHTLLAEIRQQQNRWPEAITQWEQVARIRALEPTGLLKLAEAQVHERQWEAALRTLRTLDTRSWPARFGDVHAQVRILEQQIEARRKADERGKGERGD